VKFSLFVFAAIIISCRTASAQDSVNTKNYYGYAGVQINNFVRQYINSGTTTTNNPYMLNCGFNNKKSGWGMRLGIGFNQITSTNNTGSGETHSSGDDLHLRIGVERSYKLTKHWYAGCGVDLVLNNQNDFNGNTFYAPNSQTGQIDSLTSGTKTLVTNYGIGLMGWVRYKLNKHIYFGTESSYYYLMGTKKQDILYQEWNNVTNNYMPLTSRINASVSQVNFASPIVLYMFVYF